MTEVRPIPYPADTSAKGWRFELDYELIDQSDTWDLAAEIPMGQPALLMMWLVAWRQKPCGSLPADESVIRSKCRIPQSVWARCREVCMRGWWQAEDGRLYHNTIISRVLAMLEKRAKDAKRTADRRERAANKDAAHAGVDGVSRVTPPRLTGEFDTKHQAPSTKNTNTPPPPAKSGGALSGFESFWSSWPKHPRKVAKAQCEAKWRKKGCEVIADQVVAAVVAASKSEAWRKDGGEFIPAPLVWLNQSRWEAPASEAPSLTVIENPQVAETRARLDAEADRKIATPEEIAAIKARRTGVAA